MGTLKRGASILMAVSSEMPLSSRLAKRVCILCLEGEQAAAPADGEVAATAPPASDDGGEPAGKGLGAI